MKLRQFTSSSLTAIAGASWFSQESVAQGPAPHQPSDWLGNTPLRYPDPDMLAIWR